MLRTINIDGQGIRIDMNAGTLRRYRQDIGRDLLIDMVNMGDTLDMLVIENLLYITAKTADPDLPDIDTWLSQFSTFGVYKAAGEIMKIWREDQKTLSTRKKKADQ